MFAHEKKKKKKREREREKKKKIILFRQNLLGSKRPFPDLCARCKSILWQVPEKGAWSDFVFDRQPDAFRVKIYIVLIIYITSLDPLCFQYEGLELTRREAQTKYLLLLLSNLTGYLKGQYSDFFHLWSK